MHIKVVSIPQSIAQYQDQAEKLWHNQKPFHLHDGLIANVLKVDADKVTICWVPYYLRWVQETKLLTFPSTICPLSVCALVTNRDRILVGLRSQKVASFDGHWEFAPAGSVSKVDGANDINLENQIRTEWQEELQTDFSLIRSVKLLKQPLEFPLTRVWIALFRIEVQSFEPPISEEVSAWRWLTKSQIEKEIANSSAPWVTGSNRLLEQLHQF